MTNPIIVHGDFTPIAGRLLTCIPQELLFHSKHKLRHPLGLYNISLQQLASDFGRVIDLVDAIRPRLSATAPGADDIYADLMRAQVNLLYSLREHIDDCHTILMCLVDPDKVTPREPGADNFLRSAKFPTLSLFVQPMKRYLDEYLLPVVNRLKHRQGRLRGISFVANDSLRVGYFLEEVDENEVAGPSTALHPGNTAWSFARDLRLNLYHVFLASECLVRAVVRFVEMSNLTLCCSAAAAGANGRWQAVARRIAQFEIGIFPQELTMPFPLIEIVNEGTLLLQYPSQNAALSFPPKGSSRVIVTTQGDGITRSFRFPYFQGT